MLCLLASDIGRFERMRSIETSGNVTSDTLTSYRTSIIFDCAAFCELSCNLTTLYQLLGLYGMRFHYDSGSLCVHGERYQYNGVTGYDAV